MTQVADRRSGLGQAHLWEVDGHNGEARDRRLELQCTMREAATAEEAMERQRFCVYNRSCECFLSLSVTTAGAMWERIKDLLGRRSFSHDEGLWVRPAQGFHTFLSWMALPVDLIYLSPDYRVVHVIESMPRFRIAPRKATAASLLALPAHSIHFSQTRLGNQIVICEAGEMQFRLGDKSLLQACGQRVDVQNAESVEAMFAEEMVRDRRMVRRQPRPRLVAHDWNGASLVVHGIRDASATGMYLLTEKRWPLGSLVTMTLQMTGSLPDEAERTITVEMRVMRWGADGVGLGFVQPAAFECVPWMESDGSGEELAAPSKPYDS